jgi:uncharacterized protein (TIGR03437 family)
MPLAVGSIGSIYGQNLSDGTDSVTTFPLPVKLSGSSLTLNGIAAPLFYTSAGQINFFVPWELEGQTSATIRLATGTGVAEVAGVPIVAESPGVFLADAAGNAVATHLNFQLIGAASPAVAGEQIVLFATGLGSVSNTPGDSDPAPSNPLARDEIMPTVTISGAPAQVTFAGLTPGMTGLYQINVAVPSGLPSGPAKLAISVGSVVSATAMIQLQ